MNAGIYGSIRLIYIIKICLSFQLNFTTIFHLSNKELNKAPLDCLKQVLAADAGIQNGESDGAILLCSLLFSTREDVQKLLETECKACIFFHYLHSFSFSC